MKPIRSLAAVVATTLVVGCASDPSVGTGEPGTLYDTNTVPVTELFSADGVAPPVFQDAPFVRVGLMWDATGEAILEGRTADADGVWSSWQDIVETWSEEIAHNGYLDAASAYGFQLRGRSSF